MKLLLGIRNEKLRDWFYHYLFGRTLGLSQETSCKTDLKSVQFKNYLKCRSFPASHQCGPVVFLVTMGQRKSPLESSLQIFRIHWKAKWEEEEGTESLILSWPLSQIELGWQQSTSYRSNLDHKKLVHQERSVLTVKSEANEESSTKVLLWQYAVNLPKRNIIFPGGISQNFMTSTK
jgi:hypothetical protein